jgi:hypothetical protein
MLSEATRLYQEWLYRTVSTDDVLAGIEAQSLDETMAVESAVAYRVAKRYWRESPDEPFVARGLAWYLQGRVVEHLFNVTYGRPAYRAERVCLFGNRVAIARPSLLLTRWRAGLDPRDAQCGLPEEINGSVTRAALVFATLERYLGWPVLQGALAVLAQTPDVPLTPRHTTDVVSAASGQDLEWLFALLDAAKNVDYSVQLRGSKPHTCAGTPCYQTDVVLRRGGNALFTGSSRERVGDFDAGQAIRLAVDFSDGATTDATWDGRETERALTFESEAPVARVRLDPAGTLLLDANTLDHTVRPGGATNVPLAKWIGRWSLWLQHAMLTYAAFI